MALYRDIDFRTGGCLDKLGAIPTVTGNGFVMTELGLAFKGSTTKYITYDKQLLPEDAYSLVIWAKRRLTDNTDKSVTSIIPQTTAGLPGGGPGIWIKWNIGLFFLYNDTNNYRSFNYTPDYKWHCHIVTISGNTRTSINTSHLYVDGIDESENTIINSGTPSGNRAKSLILGWGNALENNGADIARIKVYDHVLSSKEIDREQIEFNQARQLSKQLIKNILLPNNTTLKLQEDWKYYGIKNSPSIYGEWIKSSGSWAVQQLTTASGIKKKGDFILKCTGTGVIGIPSKQAYGYWEVQIMSNGLNNNGIVFMANTPYTNEPYVLALASGGIIRLRSTGGGTIMQTNGGYIDNTVMYKIRIYRTGGSTPIKFPLKLVPEGTVQSTGTFLVTIQGGIYTNETIVSTTGGAPSNPNTENGSTSCKYFNLSLTTNDIIGDIIMKDGWTG